MKQFVLPNPNFLLPGDERIIADPASLIAINSEKGPECVDGRVPENPDKDPHMDTVRLVAAGQGVLTVRSVLETSGMSGKAVTSYALLGRLEAGDTSIIAEDDLIVHEGLCRGIAHELDRMWAMHSPSPRVMRRVGSWVPGPFSRHLGLSPGQLHDGLNDVHDAARRLSGEFEVMGTPPQAQTIERVRALGGNISRITVEPTARSFVTVTAPGVTLDACRATEADTSIYTATPVAAALRMREMWGLNQKELAVAAAVLMLDTPNTEELLAGLHSDLRRFVEYEIQEDPSGSGYQAIRWDAY
ncbi:MAG TPA: hypothetical protein VLH84_05575 [Patescibacteria group bacterium]|nr:hypothetical protein [Patescibacteria group bacterium]